MSETPSDFQLLQQYLKARDQAAFAQIVRRHVDLVYAGAMRQVRDSHLAEDVSQAVFVVLSQRAGSIRSSDHLGPWLHRTTRYATANALRMRANRAKHEQKAASMRQEAGEEAVDREELNRVLDEAVDRLRPADRRVVVMRFFQGAEFGQLGAMLGLTEAAARKRVERAVAKLRESLSRRGVSMPLPVLAVALVKRVQAPDGVAAGIGAAVTGGSDAAAGLAREVLMRMAWGKARMVAGILIVAAVALGIGVKAMPGGSGSAKPQAAGTSHWQEDVDALASTIATKHANAFHAVSKDHFAQAVDELKRALPGKRDHEIVVGMMKLTSMIGDGHTSLEVPKWFTRYPVSLYWFGNELHVTRADAKHERALGARVVRIGEVDVNEATRRMRTVTSQDGENDARLFSGLTMPVAEVLHALRITKDVTHAAWTFVDAEGEFTVEMNAIPQDASINWVSLPKEMPLYRQHAGEQFWFTSVPESPGTIYVGWRGYPAADAFAKLSDELMRRIDQEKATRVILDVRLNRGGDFWRGRAMVLGKLAEREHFAKRGAVYVIVGRSTLSAAMVNAVDARQNLKATLVGEPTGSRPVGYSENDDFVLPYSKLRLTYSTKHYQFQEQDTDGVMPDQLIEPTWNDYSAGRDAAIEWILAQPVSR